MEEVAPRDPQDLLEPVVGEDDPAARGLRDHQPLGRLLEERLEPGPLGLEVADEALADARQRDPGEGLGAEVGVRADVVALQLAERVRLRERQAERPERDPVGDERHRAGRAVRRRSRRSRSEIVVGLGVVDVGQPHGLATFGPRPRAAGARSRGIDDIIRTAARVVALGCDDGQAALAQERDDRAARRERGPALLDDEVDDAVARRLGDELAGDPLEPLEPGGRGLCRAARLLLRGVDLGVRDRQRDAVRELGGDLDLGGRVAPFRPDDEEHRPDRLAPGEQRLDDHAARAHRFDDVGDLGDVAGRAAERHRVGQVLDQHRPAGPDGAGGGSARPDRRRERPDPVEAALSLRVAGDRSGSAEETVGLDEVDRGTSPRAPGSRARRAAWIVSSRSFASSRRSPASATSRARSAARFRLVRSSSMSVAVPIQPSIVPVSRQSGTTRITCQRYAPSWRRRRTVASSASSCARAAARAAANSARSSSWRCSAAGNSPVAAIRPVNSNQRSFATAIVPIRLGDPRGDRQRVDDLAVASLAGDARLAGLDLGGHVMERRDDEALAARAGVDEPGPDERPAELVGERLRKPTTSGSGRSPASAAGRAGPMDRAAPRTRRRSRSGRASPPGEATQHLVGAGPAAGSAASWFANTSRRRASLDGDPASTASRIQPSRSSDAMGPGITAGNRARWLDDSLAHVPSHSDAQPP